MESNRTLQMVFANANGDKKTVTINKPAEELEAATVSAQMDVLIGANVLLVNELPATTKVSAKFVTQTKTAVTVA